MAPRCNLCFPFRPGLSVGLLLFFSYVMRHSTETGLQAILV